MVFLRRFFFGLLSVAVLSAASQPATALEFRYKFTNGSDNAIITGRVTGLNDNATGPASSLTVLNNSLGYGIGTYGPLYAANTFTVANGVVTDWEFETFGVDAEPGAVACCSISLGWFGGQNLAGLRPFPGFAVSNPSDLVWKAVIVPLPATLPLMVAALAGLGILNRRR